MAQRSRLAKRSSRPSRTCTGPSPTSSRSGPGFPRFKSRKRDPGRFRIPQRVKVDDGKVYVPKVGWVRIRQSQAVDVTTKSATFKRDADGHWYVTLTAEFEMPDVALPPPDPAKVVGIDLGLIDFATLSDGPTRSRAEVLPQGPDGNCARHSGRLAAARTGASGRPRPERRGQGPPARSPTNGGTSSTS